MKELKFAAGYVRRYWYLYMLGILSLFLVDMVNVYVPRFTGEITDGLAAGVMDHPSVMTVVWRILLMGAVIAVGRFGWRRSLFGAGRCIERELRNDMFAHLTTLSPRYFNEHKTGDLMAHFTNDLQSVRMLVSMTVVTAFDATVMLLLVICQMILYVDARLTVVAVIPLVVIIFGDYIYGKAMHKRFLEKQQAFASLTDQVQETVSGIRVIKAFVQERRELAAFARANKNAQDKNLRVVRLRAVVMPVLDLIIGASSLLTLLYGGWLAISGEISVGQFIAFNSYIGMLIWPMMAVGECITQVSQGMASLRRIHVIFSEEPDIRDESQVEDIRELKGDIELRDLTFAYPDARDIDVLENVSVRVKAGETLAILGRTGSGKTTIPSLLLRLYDTEDGRILIDGHTLRQIPLSTLRSQIAYVPQDSFLFSDTLENNIAFGVDEVSRDRVEAAAKAACIHDNIIEFPMGYDTVVGERGVTLSGGQKQRSAIARALMKDAPILIMDDALSAVDTDTERQILQNLKENRRDRTTIIIAHRISTIQHADHILVLEDGRVAEYGDHASLLEKGGLYAGLYEKQQLEKQLNEEGGALDA
ncbi:MAG: ABC transporter ATP-binding protein [Clostridia bacterium]|nr:ABC transporter ATP-binding protein [Clostridia bacterium]